MWPHRKRHPYAEKHSLLINLNQKDHYAIL